MKDYSAMSDFELNSAVHNSKLDAPFHLEFLGGDKIRWTKGGEATTTDRVAYGKKTLLDYVNDPAAAWTIILENKINIDHRESIKSGAMASQSGRKEIYAVDKNPLRAAMIVFLMVKDEAVNTQGEKA